MKQFIIAVVQQKGGSGKSTLAAHLSVAFAKFGAKIVLIDTDPQKTIMSWKKLRDTNDSNYKINIDISSASGWKIDQEIAKFSKHDIVVIDSPPHMETETKSVVRSANLVVVPCQPSPNDLWSTDDTLELIEKEKKPAVVILNRCPSHSRLLKTAELHFDSKNIKKYFVGNRIAFSSSMLHGLTSIETESSSTATNEILQIAKELYQKYFKSWKELGALVEVKPT